MQRARQEAPLPEPKYEEPELAEQDLRPSPVHPLHRYAAQHAEPAPEPEYREDLPFPEAGQEADPSRYDDALYGQIETGEQDFQRDPAYPNDPYAYQSEYEEEEPAPRRRSSGLMTVAAVLALGRGRDRRVRSPIETMSARPVAASRRSSRLTTARPR